MAFASKPSRSTGNSAHELANGNVANAMHTTARKAASRKEKGTDRAMSEAAGRVMRRIGSEVGRPTLVNRISTTFVTQKSDQLWYGRVLMTPSVGLLAVPYNRFGIRPAKNASRPAIAACFIALAISAGFLA